MSTRGDRLKTLMAYYNLKQVEFANKLGITSGYMSLVARDKEPMTMGVLDSIIEMFPKVNIHWLLTGVGDMLLQIKNSEIKVGEDDGEYFRQTEVGAIIQQLEDHEHRIEYLANEIEKFKMKIK